MRHEIVAPEMKQIGGDITPIHGVFAHVPTAMDLDREVKKLITSGGGKLEQTNINRMNGNRQSHVEAHQLLDVHVGKRNDITAMLEKVTDGAIGFDEEKLRQNADYFDERITDLQEDVRTTNARLMEGIRAKDHTF